MLMLAASVEPSPTAAAITPMPIKPRYFLNFFGEPSPSADMFKKSICISGIDFGAAKPLADESMLTALQGNNNWVVG